MPQRPMAEAYPMSSVDDELVITRVFQVPLVQAFKAWTDPEALSRWWVPEGLIWVLGNLDLRAGGVSHYCMRLPDGRKIWARFICCEITTCKQIAFINSFSDEKCGIARHPFKTNWPLQMVTRATFAKHASGTTVRVRCYPINATPLERRTFRIGHKALREVFTGMLDQLSAYLFTVQTEGENRRAK